MGQYALYLRKSRADLDAEARGEGETLSKHRTALREFAKQRGLLIAHEYAEIVSGDTIAARPQMQALLADVKAGMYAGVIVNDIDRLGRGDSIDQEIIKITFAASHTLIITPLRDIDPANPSDDDMLDFTMFMARFEYKKIAQRLKVGKYRSAAAGNYVAARVPYGYMRVYNNGTATLAPHPEQAEVVKMVFEWYASGKLGYLAIAKRLVDMGITTSAGHQFTAQAVRNILTTPVYLGISTYGKTHQVSVIEDGKRIKKTVPSDSPITIENAHPSIVSRELYESAQARRGRIAPVNTAKDISNPLAGLVRCSECGYTMTAHRRNEIGVRYISCEHRECHTLSSKLNDVESALLAAIKEYAVTYTPPQENPATIQNKAIFERQLETLQKRLSRARELVELGTYTPQEYMLQRDDIQSKINAVKSQLDSIDTPKPVPVPTSVIFKTIDAYQYAQSASEKNALLKSIIDHVVYTKTERRSHDGSDTFSLDVFPVLCDSI